MKYCGVLVETSPVDYNWTSFVYLAEIAFIPPPPCNEGTLEWIHFDDVLNMPTPKTDRYIYKYILEQKHFSFHADFDEQLNLARMEEAFSGKLLLPA